MVHAQKPVARSYETNGTVTNKQYKFSETVLLIPCTHTILVVCVQVNEAFAAQFLSVEKELGLDRERTNVNGGAIALGHPLAASGSRITAHLVHEMRRRNVRYSIGSACIGGGQGIAVLLEKVD